MSAHGEDPRNAREPDASAQRPGGEQPELTRSAGQLEGRCDGAVDGLPEGRVMALVVLVRRRQLTNAQARTRLRELIRDGRVGITLGLSADALLMRTRPFRSAAP